MQTGLLIAAVVVFIVEVVRTYSLIAAGLALFAGAFLAGALLA